ncbi:hypothetical protein [Rheinheimera sp. UJ63]|uniref:hypothetical protein n=1 Tax=Rheinheimera sp. UJ63 TaxID=2910157 RepID=UPI001F479BEB|nr:hypothetical protein [Rheinheimera sp. UJ63]MCF4010062.1 hypothetical protein [Rheinheimera sp. UJ63]
MKNTTRLCSAAVIISLCCLFSVDAADPLVTDKAAFSKTLRAAKPSDTMMNGVPNGSVNRYQQVVKAQNSQNSVINVDNI